MSRRSVPKPSPPQLPTKKKQFRRKNGYGKPASKKGTSAVEHAKAINAIDPGRYKFVEKNGKVVPVYQAKLERTLARRCTGMNNLTGLQCGNPPMHGTTVCFMHGGHLPVVKAAAERRIQEAQQRFIEEVEPTITRLTQIRDQDDHYPSALGASQAILNRAMGKVGETKKDPNAGRQTIKIGITIGARKRVDSANQEVAVGVVSESAPVDGDVVE